MKWRKASERLPEKVKHYLCKFNGVPTVFYIDKGNDMIVTYRGEIMVKGLWCDIEWLDEQATDVPDGWVSVKDRLPTEGGRYWCYIKEVDVFGVSYFQWNCSYHEIEKRWGGHGVGKVTHWQPLPPPPKQ